MGIARFILHKYEDASTNSDPGYSRESGLDGGFSLPETLDYSNSKNPFSGRALRELLQLFAARHGMRQGAYHRFQGKLSAEVSP
ncbi:MAG: hypothetical protein COA94_07295 [Rickettsiales bacterium]|nr:MAG: hypothetical protein COA94_07295 [Rickettsiales bacterium]